MPEKRKPINMQKVYYVCDSCEFGTLTFNSKVKLSQPPKYLHRCSNCGSTIETLIKYPYVEYTDGS